MYVREPTDSQKLRSQFKNKAHQSIAISLVAVVSAATLALGAGTAVAATSGYLSQSGCVVNAALTGCTLGVALNGASSVTVSGDGKNAYVAASGTINTGKSNAVAIFDRNTTTGALTQKEGPAGCISENGSNGNCTDGKALNGANSVTISGDGKNVYVASSSWRSNAVAIFDRNTTTGALTQKEGTAGCISETGFDHPDGTGGACADGKALDAASVTVSPDGKNAYVASQIDSSAVAVFDRNPTTGALTQKEGAAGCISDTGTNGACTKGKALNGANSVTVSGDGKNAYVTSWGSDAIAVFDRNPTTGALTQKEGAAGCTSDTGTNGACTKGKALDGANSVTVSGDGKNAYVASQIDSNAVAIFDRNTTTGALTQKEGAAGCISDTGTNGACTLGKALSVAASITLSGNGKNAYVASHNSSAVAIFDRNTTTGALTQKEGAAGCISDTGTNSACTLGKALVGANSVTVSGDGKNAYVASSTEDPSSRDGVAVFDIVKDRPASAFKKACNLQVTSPRIKGTGKVKVSKKKARRLFTQGAKGRVKWGTVSGQKIKCEKIKMALLEKRGKRLFVPGTKIKIPSSALKSEKFNKTVSRLHNKYKLGKLQTKEASSTNQTKFSYKVFRRSSKLGRSALNRLRGKRYKRVFIFYLSAEIEGRRIVKKVELRAG